MSESPEVDLAARLLEEEIEDNNKHSYDDAAEERHQRRLRAMRALGDAERTGWRLYSITVTAIIILVAACVLFGLTSIK